MRNPENQSNTYQSGQESRTSERAYNPQNGNMLSRRNQVQIISGAPTVTPRDLTEYFTYSTLDQLHEISSSGVTTTYHYKPGGSIDFVANSATNTNMNYVYDNFPAHAVKNVSPIPIDASEKQQITYTPFNKIAEIQEGDQSFSTNYSKLQYYYGLGMERRKMIEKHFHNGQLQQTKTKIYCGNYEKEEIQLGNTINQRQLHYIFAPDGLAGILELKNGQQTMYYASTDHLGSINMLLKENGSITSDLSYDVWGRPRNAADWTFSNVTPGTITDRGFTFHEQMRAFNLINMNGRAYDPTLGQFLSPDPFVQAPENSQNYNRFAYCLNNPLKYTDPSGYEWGGPWYFYNPNVGWEFNFHNNVEDDGGWIAKNKGEKPKWDPNYNSTMEGYLGETIVGTLNDGSTFFGDENGHEHVGKEIKGAEIHEFNVFEPTIVKDNQNKDEDFWNYKKLIGAVFTIEDTYNNFIHDHKIYKTPKGQIRNLYKPYFRKAIKSTQAAKYIKISKWLDGIGLLGTAYMVTDAMNNIKNGKGSYFDVMDITAGTVGLTNAYYLKLTTYGIPIIGEGVALYGCVRFAWDFGENAGPSTWWGDPNVWWGYKLGF